MNRLALLAASLLVTSAAHAGTWAEVGDAGDLTLTGQSTVGTGSLNTITGTLPTDADIDVFAINVTDHNNFFAGINNLVQNLDPDFWMFDAFGNGVGHSDIVQGGMSSVGSSLVTSNGLYYVAVSSDGAEALSSLGQIWSTGPGAARAPDGPGAGLPLIGWGGTPFNDLMNYTITLGGAEFAVAPEPTSAAALFAAGPTLVRRRRRRS